MGFEFYSPCRVICGENRFLQAPEICSGYGKNILIVTYRFLEGSPVIENFKNGLKGYGMDYAVFSAIKGEPTVETAEGAACLAREKGCGCVISIGGGSVIDTGKAAAGLISNSGPLKDYLEGVGTGKKLVNPPVPFIAVPTTGGTGAEATKNAVVSDKEGSFKKSFRDERLFARCVIIDPVLHAATPQKVTAESGMDAITQLIESYTSVKSTPFSEIYALRGLYYARSLKKAYDDGNDLNSRQDMALAALMSGIALSTSGLGAAHGVAASLGINLGIFHGRACAIMLPHVIKLNKCCIEKYSRIAEILCGCRGTTEENYACLIDYISGLNAYFNIEKDLKNFNISDGLLRKIAKGSLSSSMGGNPVKLNENGIYGFLKPLT